MEGTIGRQIFSKMRFTGLALAACLCASGAQAQESGSAGLQFLRDILVPDRTIVTAGVGPEFNPDYFGSDDYEFGIGTSFLLKFRNATFGEDGVSLDLVPFADFEFGPYARLAGGRSEDSNPALEGLGDIGRTLELGAFGAVEFADRYRFRARYRHAIATGHRGGLLDAELGALLYEGRRISSAAGARLTWVDNDYADAFFTVTDGESLNSGVLPAFEAGGGLRDVQFSWNGRYRFSDRWALNAYARYNYLLGDASDTPIVSLFGSRNQFGAGLNLTYEFDFATPGTGNGGRDR